MLPIHLAFLKKYEERSELPVSIAALANHVHLQGPDDLIMERRALDLTENSLGEVTATSFKPYNLLQLQQVPFQQASIALLAGGGAALTKGAAVGTVLGLLALFGAFLQHAKKEYNAQDAKVLLAIYHLGKQCHLATIAPEYQRLFAEELPADSLTESLNTLALFRTVSRVGETIEIIETVNLTRQ